MSIIMKTLFNKFPITSRFILATILFGSSLIISGLINKGSVKEYFPYASSILLFIATWLLFKTDKKTLKAIGLNFNLKNMSFLPLGIFIGAFAFLGAKILRSLYSGEAIEIAEYFNYKTMLYSLYVILPTVAVEEFLFRGYLFKKTIEVSNVVIANVIFSILFMLIHVLDENVINNIGMIVFLAVTISFGHLLFATALLKSKSLFFPIGIHLGNNWATHHLISNSNSGNSFLYISNIVRFDTWTPFLLSMLIFNGFFLLVTFLIWKWNKVLILVKRK